MPLRVNQDDYSCNRIWSIIWWCSHLYLSPHLTLSLSRIQILGHQAIRIMDVLPWVQRISPSRSLSLALVEIIVLIQILFKFRNIGFTQVTIKEKVWQIFRIYYVVILIISFWWMIWIIYFFKLKHIIRQNVIITYHKEVIYLPTHLQIF